MAIPYGFFVATFYSHAENTEAWIVVVVNSNEIARRGTRTHTQTPTPIVACAFFSNHTSI